MRPLRLLRRALLVAVAVALIVAPLWAARTYMDNRDASRARMARILTDLRVNQAITGLRAEQNARRIADVEEVARQNCQTLNTAAHQVNAVIDYVTLAVRSSPGSSAEAITFVAGLPRARLHQCPPKRTP